VADTDVLVAELCQGGAADRSTHSNRRRGLTFGSHDHAGGAPARADSRRVTDPTKAWRVDDGVPVGMAVRGCSTQLTSRVRPPFQPCTCAGTTE
jgi:hypothetical protein